MKNAQLVTSCQGVQLYIGNGLKATAGKQIKLGTLAVRYVIEGYIITNRKFDIYADLDSCIEICGFSGVRNNWEKELRTNLGYDPAFSGLSPEGTTDYFIVRLNPTNKLYAMGWKDQSVDMRRRMRDVYL